MKNHKKRQFFAGKWWLSIFLLLFGLFSFGQQVEAKTCSSYITSGGCIGAKDDDGESECEWSTTENKCSRAKKNCADMGELECFLNSRCHWDKYLDENKCILKTTDTIKKKGFNPSDCAIPDDNSSEAGAREFLKSMKGEELVVKEGDNEEKKFTISSNGWIGVNGSVQEACEEVFNQGGEMCLSPYRLWLNRKGRKKCKGFDEELLKQEKEKCIEKADFWWLAHLNDNDYYDEYIEMKDVCIGQVQAEFEEYYYDGPVFDGPGLSGGAQMAQMELSNSISKQRDIKKLLISWSKFAIEIAIVLAVIAIIWAGIRFITDMGDGAGIEAAKKIIMWTIIGLILIMGSYAIVNTVINARFGSDLAVNVNINHFIT